MELILNLFCKKTYEKGHEMLPWQRWGKKTGGRLYSVRKHNIPHMLTYGCIILPCCMYPVGIKDVVDAINNV